jgi:hypothetical protein
VLDVAYAGVPGWKPGSIDFAVKARVEGDSVYVSYRRPGTGEADNRIELAPIPLHLL